MRTLHWIGLAVAALLIGIGIALAWLVNTQGGAGWASNFAVKMLHGKLTIESVEGTLVGPLQVTGLRYVDPDSGVDARIQRASTDLLLRELLARRVHVETAAVDGLALYLSEPKKKKEHKPFSLKPPIDIVLDRFTLAGADIERNGKPLLVITRADAAGRWTAAGIAVRQLNVTSPDGEIHLNGRLGERGSYVGRLAGSFSWRVGERLYAGQLQGSGSGRRANVALQLSSPLAAQLDARLEQGDTLFAEVRGNVTANGQRLRIEPLRVRLQEQVVKIETLTLIDPSGRGRLEARGDVRLDQKPFFADLAAQWRDVSLPKEWVGQALATRGELKVRGNPSTFNASGDLMLGPPQRLAHITLKLHGTPQEIELERLTIAEQGKLDARGKIRLEPVRGWQLSAQADDFNPGAFVAGWPGRLDLTLACEGTLEEAGPRASLEMNRLEGTLRQRRISGRASLSLTPDKVVAGTLQVRSGGSVLNLKGDRGQSMNVLAQFDVATLDDWIPQSGGKLNGRFHITGRWPKLAIEGTAHGSGLAFAGSALDSIDVDADIDNPLNPAGTLQLSATELRTGGFEFKSVAVDASGSQQNHTVAVVVTGEPLNGEVRVTGAHRGRGWMGTVEQLRVSATNVAALALREPAQVAVSDAGFSISQSCLANDEMSVCVAAQQGENGTLQANYRIEHLPLALIAAVAKPDLPFQLTGTLEGEGQLRRTRDGALFGEIRVTSAQGSAREAEDVAEALLGYENFAINATLDGDTAKASTSASLVGNRSGAAAQGTLRGEATLGGLRSAAPSIDGHVELKIDDLAPVALFTPQLADVAGRAAASVDLSGKLKAPDVTGRAEISQFAAEVPKVGIKLEDGAVTASMKSGGNISVVGHVTSGKGKLQIDGATGADGVLRVKINGERFLAANIPAAHVFVTPDLELTRTGEEFNLTGTVRVPSANIDLTKLPQGGPRKASADVVVIDDEIVEESRKVPLHATITVILGNDVELVGFGLKSKLGGQLVVYEVPGQATTGSGEINVAGTYKAYGQDLTIEQGRLLFAASPLANPQVNLTATRTLPEATIKLSVTGPAQRPLLSVSSTPSMSQTEALSYLVTGKPLNQLGTGEGDVVQSAARSLGGAAGNLLAKNVGKRIGVDEIGIESSAELGGSAFTVGQYLSPRLYLSYGVGLFEPGQVVTLRYRISDKVSLEASQGPLNQRAGVTYKVEK